MENRKIKLGILGLTIISSVGGFMLQMASYGVA